MPLLKREPQLFPTDLLEPGAPRRPPGPWRVAHVRSRQEKALARHLHAREVPYYLPQREHRLRAGGRWRTSHLPLFSGYVFFRGEAAERRAAQQSNLLVHLLEVTDQEALERELRSLWLLQVAGAPLVPHPYLGPGDEVEITDGPLRGYHGRVLREQGNLRLVVTVSLLRQSVSAVVDRAMVAPPARRRSALR